MNLLIKLQDEKILQKENQKNSFKDKCDKCGKFDYLNGINNKCLCSKCTKIILKDTQKEVIR